MSTNYLLAIYGVMYHGHHGVHPDERLLLIIIEKTYVRRKEEKVHLGHSFRSNQSNGHSTGWLRRWQCHHVTNSKM